jgi:hypothetical protein
VSYCTTCNDHPFLTLYHHHPLRGDALVEALESALSPHPLPHPSHLTCFGAGSSFPLICSSWLGSSAPGTVHTLVDWWQQDPLLFTHLIIHCPPCSMFTPLWNTHSSGASMPLVTPWETPSTLGEYLTCPPLGNPVAIQGSTTFTLRCPAGSCLYTREETVAPC